jgi:uncharacterized RDD family membrane protein YckC
MDVNEESLRKRYAQMDNEELIELRTNGDLTELASAILDDELRKRNLTEDNIRKILEQSKQGLNDTFPLASLGSRLIAQIIDTFIAIAIFLVPVVLTGGNSETASSIGIFLYILYYLLQDGLPNGQSIGKKFLKIAVINKTTGKACGYGESFFRNFMLGFLGIIDLVFMFSKYRQRLGDMAANTVVVRAPVATGELKA